MLKNQQVQLHIQIGNKLPNKRISGIARSCIHRPTNQAAKRNLYFIHKEHIREQAPCKKKKYRLCKAKTKMSRKG